MLVADEAELRALGDGDQQRKTSAKRKKPVESSQSSKRSKSVPQRVTVALSGFNADESRTIETLIKGINAGGAAGLLLQTTASSDPAEPFDFVVAEEKPKTPRTVKILFALARGRPVLTKDWLYALLDGPADASLFLHPRYSSVSSGALKCLDGQRVLLGPIAEPPADVLAQLVQCLGGAVVASAALADFVFVADKGSHEQLLRGLTDAGHAPTELRRLCRDRRVLRLKVTSAVLCSHPLASFNSACAAVSVRLDRDGLQRSDAQARVRGHRARRRRACPEELQEQERRQERSLRQSSHEQVQRSRESGRLRPEPLLVKLCTRLLEGILWSLHNSRRY